MEQDKQMVGLISQSEEYSKELDVAVRAVQIACSLCNKVQNNLILKPNSNSSVTVAGEFPKSLIFVDSCLCVIHVVIRVC
jgi:3'(2'), 5'-bisphosphate nucleotidase